MARRRKNQNDLIGCLGCLGTLFYFPFGVVLELAKPYSGGGRRRR